MTTAVSSNKVTTQANTEVLYRESLGTTKRREKVRKISDKQLEKFAEKKNIQPGFFTDVEVTKNKNGKAVYEVFMNYKKA